MGKRAKLTKWKELFSPFQIEAGVFLFLLISFVCGAKGLDIWSTAWYAMDYSLGFGSRLLIGSILQFFYSDYLNSWLIYCFVVVCIVIMLALIALFIGFCIRNAPSESAKQGITLLSLLYLACPASPGYLWTALNMGKLDLYLLLFTILTCFVFLKLSSFTLQCICWGVIGILCVAIHQVYIFIFFPLTLVMIANTLFDSRWNSKHVAAGTGTIAAICGIFLFFQFCSHINPANVEDLYALLSAKTDIYISKKALWYEYFANTSDHINLVMPDMPVRIIFCVVSLTLLSPLLAIYGYLWGKAYRLSPQKHFKNKYLWMNLVMLAYLPPFVLTADWGRWLAAFFTVQFLAVVVLLQKGDLYLTTAVESLVEFFKQKKFFFVLFLLYLAMLGKMAVGDILPRTETFTLLSNILTYFESITGSVQSF